MSNGFIVGNRILDIVLVALIAAQTLKFIVTLIKEKKINFRRFLDTGSMPSSHTASVTALATSVGIREGIASVLFAISLVLAIVVMYDATGVRRAAGKQAEVLNKIVANIKKKEGHSIIEENLKEFIGHTPMEVFWGAILGIVIAFFLS
ncbi:MAG: divergent PAP2 family protein [Candidatus Cloacimonetes bacterium]|nr:divergent PAP2 family protein [Candidatus Cloacimonadota bacterium]